MRTASRSKNESASWPALVEGVSVRGTARMVGVDKKTVLRLLADVGDACDAYLDHTIRGLKSQRLQGDEIWSFCHAKERNLKPQMRGGAGVGDLWTWTAIDADTKLIVTWHLGKRTRHDANVFVRDRAERITSERVQITTDGLGSYSEPIQRFFCHRADYGNRGQRLRPLRRRHARAQVFANGREARPEDAALWRPRARHDDNRAR